MTNTVVSVPAWLRAGVICGLALVCGVLAVGLRQVETQAETVTVHKSSPYHPSLPVPGDLDPSDESVPSSFSLQRGQTLGQLLRELGLDGRDAHGAVTALASELNLRQVRAGQAGLAYYDGAGELTELRFNVHRRGRLTLERDGDTWRTELREYERGIRLRSLEGRLETFLFSDVERAGGDPAVAVAMSNVLQWDLDFNRDLRKGDTFRVLYEELLLDNRFDGVGRVLGLVYENRGVRHEAFLFGEDGAEGYYDSDGRPLQKMFLKSPLPFMRVTSRFTHSRFHPVLKKNRPHYGVDLGAPTGTPVRATASGTVMTASRQGGAGKMVKLRHPNGYETMYLHLSGYGKNIRRGAKVRQGDVIGYVGSTGLSTGPHLDYRVKKSGRYLNPLKLENRPAEPISKARMAAFSERRDELLSTMLPTESGAASAEGDPAGRVLSAK